MNELRTRKPIKGQAELLGNIAAITTKYYDTLSHTVRKRKNNYGLLYWEEFLMSPSFEHVEHFLVKEETIVNFELENAQKRAEKSNENLGDQVKDYAIMNSELLKKEGVDERQRQDWIHLSHVLDVAILEKLMTQEFDFKHYYCEYGKYEIKELVDQVRNRVKAMWLYVKHKLHFNRKIAIHFWWRAI